MHSSVDELRLVARSGPLNGTTFPVPASRLVVGRDVSCDLQIEDPKISRIHGWFEVLNSSLYYTDNSSTNGSFVNGQRISEAARLEPGDIVSVGSTEFALLDSEDFHSINFVSTESTVTRSLSAGSVHADALAEKFADLFDHYRAGSPESQDAHGAQGFELVTTQRLLTSLKALQTATRKMSSVLPVNELIEVLGDGLFEVFSGAENMVILLHDEETDRSTPKLSRNREGDMVAGITISRTVLRKAIEERATIIASDVDRDQRFSTSDSLLGMSVKSVICAPLSVGERVLGVLYLDSRMQRVTFDDLDAEVVTAFANQAAIALDNARLYDELQESYHQTLQALVQAIEARDEYTRGHTHRVKEYSLAIGKELGFPQKHLHRLGMAADLHDIGKIGIREGIIGKPGRLTDTEFLDIQKHVEKGARILEPIKYLHDVIPWIRGHHEKWDGSGYPDKLKGEECPLEGRVLALADAFDAMTSKRPYNKPLTRGEALGRIMKESGKHFDPRVVEAFEKALEKMEEPARDDPSTKP